MVFKIAYVRYVDDFLFGVAGPKSLVNTLKKRVTQFVKSNLKLELIGGEVTHVSSGKILFLGLEVKGVAQFKFPRRLYYALEKRKSVIRNFVLQKHVKENTTLKYLLLSLRKAVKNSFFADVKDLPRWNFTLQAIKKAILFGSKFNCLTIANYREFVKRVYSSHACVPDSLKNVFKALEHELVY